MVYLGIVEGLLLSRESLGLLAETPSLALERGHQFFSSSSLALACQASTKPSILWLPETSSLALACQTSTKPTVLGLLETSSLALALRKPQAA